MKDKILVISGVSDKSGGSNAALVENILLLRDSYDFLVVVPENASFSKQLKQLNIKYVVVKSRLWRTGNNDLTSSKIKKSLRKLKKLLINIIADLKLAKIITKESIDLVHINISAINVGFIASKLTQKPLLWHLRELNDIDQNAPLDFKGIAKISFRNAHLVAISKFVEQYYKKFIQKNSDIPVLYDGIDTDKLAKIPDLPKRRPKVLKVLFLGGYQSHKGLDVVLKMLKIVTESTDIKIQLTVFGSQFKNNSPMYIRYVNKNNLRNYVSFNGFSDDLSKAYAQTDVVISAALEAFGRVAAEGIASGRIVLGTDIGATPELITEGKNGLLYERNSAEDLAMQITKVYENWYSLISGISTIRSSFILNFSSKRTAQELDDMYQELIIKG